MYLFTCEDSGVDGRHVETLVEAQDLFGECFRKGHAPEFVTVE